MPDPISLLALTALVASHAPSWLVTLRTTLLDKGKDLVVSRGEGFMQRLLRLDEKEQLRHIEQALKNATERGLAQFDTLQERDQYKDVLFTLSQSGPMGDQLRQETMHIFTLSQTPNLAALTNTYNQRKRYYDANHQDINAGPYLQSFFTALIGELYADPYFRPQLSDALQLRAASSQQQSLLSIFDMLKRIGETLSNDYSIEDFERDKTLYADHIEQTLRNLKIIGVVPKDLNSDPELSGIFVPLRIAMKGPLRRADFAPVPIDIEDQASPAEQPDALLAALEHFPCLVLLGGPGSGKSTVTKYLAWSHASVTHPSLGQPDLLSGNPLPLRIELRRLNEQRKQGNYDFLSFVTEVLLKREGIEINPQMFKELLTRRAMLLLFDGLDEVATIDERLQLVTEIEHFALRYPGNRVLVTSRPVGYELAPISHPLFQTAEVQNFNDEQIEQFLKNWYSAVLRLTLIPQREQEELHLLIDTLKENPRLHKLAENPLLLTVITALHRYERLPDRRVLVYDRCADLLLETWARLRGTHERWKNMKLTKEDQYACVAYLGFLLHERSQEEPDNEKKGEDETVDVSLRFISTSVETFIKKQKLITSVSEQRQEAKRFIALVQEEAGLIVERGTDENSEAFYGFVHRTFQEYFAAADVYERYMQKEDRKVISNFLIAHLHDPHWREVILLLLGKLKSTPVTNQLRQLLQGKIRPLRSRYTEIMQQDLFFVCDCLLEEIKVEKTLVDLVLLRLTEVVRNTWSPDQRKVALEYLGKLTKTQQYAGQGMKELVTLAKDEQFDVVARCQMFEVLYLYSTPVSKERDQVESLLTNLLNRSDLLVEQVRKYAALLYPLSSKINQLGMSILMILVNRTDLSFEQMRQNALSLYQYSPSESETQHLVLSVLTTLLDRPDISVEQTQQTVKLLYRNRLAGSASLRLAELSLIRLLRKCANLSVEQMQEIAALLYRHCEEGSEAEQLAESVLTTLLKRVDLLVEQIGEIVDLLYRYSPEGSAIRQLAELELMTLLKRTDLSVDQLLMNIELLYRYNEEESATQQLAGSMVMALLQRLDLSAQQIGESVDLIYQYNPEGSTIRQSVALTLMAFLKRPDLSVEQVQKIVELLYEYSPEGSEAEQLAESTAARFLSRPDLSVEQIQEMAELLSRYSPEGSMIRQSVESRLMALINRTDLPVEQTWQCAVSLYEYGSKESAIVQQARSILMALAKRTDLSVEQVLTSVKSLSKRSKSFYITLPMLMVLVKRADLSVGQIQETAVLLYHCSWEGSDFRLLATSVLLTLLSDISETENKEDMYFLLREMIPQFHKIPFKIYFQSDL